MSDPWVDAHKERIWSRMEHDVFTQIGDRHIADLNPPDILALIRKVEARGALDVSRRIRQSIGAVFRGGSVRLNRFRAFSKWISASVMPPPLRASAG